MVIFAADLDVQPIVQEGFAGCGLEQMRFLNPGDVVELEVEGIGILRNRVVK